MTNLVILSEEEIQAFENPPRFTYEERKHFFTLAEWAEEVVAKLATPESKIGFVLQLGYFRATGKFYAKDLFYPDDIAFIQKRLGIQDAWETTQYAGRTMRRHRSIILKSQGYTSFSPSIVVALSAEAEGAVEKQLRLKDILNQLLKVLEQKRTSVPSYSTLAGIITNAFRKYEKWMLSQITRCLSEADRQLLDDLLTVDEHLYSTSEKQDVTLKRPKVTLLRKFHQSAKPGKIKANIADLLVIKELFNRFMPVCDKLQLSRPVIEHYANLTIKVQNFQIERRNEKRYLYLLCFIIHQYYTLHDMLIEKLVKVVQTATNNAKKKQQDNYFARKDEHLAATTELANACQGADEIVVAVKRIVFLENISDQEKLLKLRALLKKNGRYSSLETRRLISKQRKRERRAKIDADYFDALEAQSHWLQNRVSDIVRYTTFNEDTSQKSIMSAITHFQTTDGKLSAHAPIGCFSKKERRAVMNGKKGIRVSLYINSTR